MFWQKFSREERNVYIKLKHFKSSLIIKANEMNYFSNLFW
jgi:hypothetical protein